jgi:hypothetical protein
MQRHYQICLCHSHAIHEYYARIHRPVVQVELTYVAHMCLHYIGHKMIDEKWNDALRLLVYVTSPFNVPPKVSLFVSK